MDRVHLHSVARLCESRLWTGGRRRRRSLEDLIESTPADGLVAGIGSVNGELFAGSERVPEQIAGNPEAPTIAFFTGCGINYMYPAVGEAFLQALKFLGRPPSQSIEQYMKTTADEKQRLGNEIAGALREASAAGPLKPADVKRSERNR